MSAIAAIPIIILYLLIPLLCICAIGYGLILSWGAAMEWLQERKQRKELITGEFVPRTDSTERKL